MAGSGLLGCGLLLADSSLSCLSGCTRPHHHLPRPRSKRLIRDFFLSYIDYGLMKGRLHLNSSVLDSVVPCVPGILTGNGCILCCM